MSAPQLPQEDQSPPTLWLASAVVLFGTALIDPARLPLLTVPVAFLVAAFGAGEVLCRVSGAFAQGAPSSPVLHLTLRLATGIAAIAAGTVLAALAGAVWIAGGVSLLLLVYGLLCLLRARRWGRSWQWAPLPVAGGLLLGLLWLIGWLWATTPPVFFDELAYHLVIPQRVVQSGTLHTAPWVVFTMMPHAADLLLSWGMAVADEAGARATHLAIWVVCSLAVLGLAEAIAGPGLRPASSLVAACLFASSPMLWFLGTLAFAETALTMAVLAIIGVLLLGRQDRGAWLPLGLLLGFAAGVKLTGLSWVLGAGLAALPAGWPLRSLRRAGLVAGLLFLPWPLRALWHTGNPLYPAAHEIFGEGPWADENQARALGDLPPTVLDLGLAGTLRLPLDLVLHPYRFGSAADAGPIAVTAVCVLLALPAVWRVLGVAPEDRRVGNALAAFTLVAGTAWALTTTTTRFLAPALALALAALSGWLLRAPVLWQVWLLPFLVLAGAVGTGQFIAQHAAVFASLDVAFGREPATSYLSKRLDHYETARYARETLAQDAVLLFIGETRPYYFGRASVAPSAYDQHPLQHWVAEAASAGDLVRRLKDEGITHVVLNVREFGRIHRKYGVLAFTGPHAEAEALRLRRLPSRLRLLFDKHGVFLFEVPEND